jgi:selenocysteine lyase/cysteine desulfurase
MIAALTSSSTTTSAPALVRSTHALGVDFMVTGCLKCLLAAAGRFLYVRRDLIERFEPIVTGWLAESIPSHFASMRWTGRRRQRFEAGRHPCERLRGPAAPAARQHRIRRGGSAGRPYGRPVRIRRGRGRFLVRTPAASERRGPLVVVQCVDGPALVQKLAGRGIIASSRGNGLRVAFHAYNTESDVDEVIRALVAESALLERAPATARADLS